MEITENLKAVSTLLQNAFPTVDRNTNLYYQLIYLLYDDFSDRNLAGILSHTYNFDYHDVLNDIAKVISSITLSTDNLENVKMKLDSAGYFAWLNDNP